MTFVVVVIPGGVTFALVPLPLPAGHVLRLPLPLLLLPLPPLQLLVMLLGLTLVLLQRKGNIPTMYLLESALRQLTITILQWDPIEQMPC